MQTLIISDKEYQTEKFNRLNHLVSGHLNEKGMVIEEVQIEKGELAFCKGCFGCWVKKPGECVIQDRMAQINHSYVSSEVTVYLCPIVFGQFSANIKNAVDRWLPNMLPFFVIRPDNSTIHPARYSAYPQTIIIGYGDELSEEDAQLFIDITAKHRRSIKVLTYQGKDDEFIKAFSQIQLKKVGALL